MRPKSLSAAPARTEEMAVIHRIFRRGFPMMAELVRQTPPGATARSEPIAAHLDFLLNGLHNHHTGEDEHIWPRLLERAAPQAELITRMEKQHEVVAERSERVRTLLETWRRTADDGEALATALDEFTAALVEHLDDEEAHVVPLIRAHITAEEWTRVRPGDVREVHEPREAHRHRHPGGGRDPRGSRVVPRRPPAPDQADVATRRPAQVRPLHPAGSRDGRAMTTYVPATPAHELTQGSHAPSRRQDLSGSTQTLVDP